MARREPSVRIVAAAAILVLAGSGVASEAAEVDCLVSPHRVADLAFGSPGLVRTVTVERGDRIGRGTLLASLDTTVEQSSLEIAQAQVAAAAAIESAQAQLDLAKKRLDRNQTLLDRQNVAASRFEEVKGDYDVARLKLAELEEARRLRALDVARVDAMLGLRRIVSPFDAVVVERHVSPGEFIENKRALTVAEIDPLFVDLIAPAAAFAAVKAGQPLDVVLAHPTNRKVVATATVIDPFVDASSGTFRIRAVLPNPAFAIVPGFRCRAELPFVEDAQ